MDLDIFKTQLDIVEVIGSFVPLKRAGVNYTCCCPFHNEKSPSFMVSPQRQIYKCFGCGAGGDVISFVKEYKKIEFKEAVSELCEMYHLSNLLSKKESVSKGLQERLKLLSDVFIANLLEGHSALREKSGSLALGGGHYPQGNSLASTPHNPNFSSQILECQSIETTNGQDSKNPSLPQNGAMQTQVPHKILVSCDDFRSFASEDAGSYLSGSDQVRTKQSTKSAQEANLASQSMSYKLRHYLSNRGFDTQDITNFSLGYCKGDEWKQFFSLEEAIKIGIVSEKGYCLFANRLTITLFNASYKPIGFVGRTHPYFNFRNSPKYINSREGILYQKSKNLYNFARAKSHIIASKKVLVVEGYMDALSAWKMGIKNCIATGGTAFNKTFLAQILPLEPEITFLFDNDEAGQKNILNAIRVCLENGYSNVCKGSLKESVKDLGEVLELRAKHLKVNSPLAQDTRISCASCQSLHTQVLESGAVSEMNFVGYQTQGAGSYLSGSDQTTRVDSRESRSETNQLPAPKITKSEGVWYYLRESIARLDSIKAKDEFLNQWKAFVSAQKNHFFKLDLVEKTKKALGVDIGVSSAPKATPNHTQAYKVFESIVCSEQCAYIASEYLDGSELGEFAQDYRAFVRGELTPRIEELQFIGVPLDLASFRKSLGCVLNNHYASLIATATLHTEFEHARALSLKKQQLRKTFS